MRIATEYRAPEIEIVECAVEQGFDLSSGGGSNIPDFDDENNI